MDSLSLVVEPCLSQLFSNSKPVLQLWGDTHIIHQAFPSEKTHPNFKLKFVL